MQPRYSAVNETLNGVAVYFIERWLNTMRLDPDFVPDMSRMINLHVLGAFDEYDYSVWDDPFDFGLTIRMVAVNRIEELTDDNDTE